MRDSRSVISATASPFGGSRNMKRARKWSTRKVLPPMSGQTCAPREEIILRSKAEPSAAPFSVMPMACGSRSLSTKTSTPTSSRVLAALYQVICGHFFMAMGR